MSSKAISTAISVARRVHKADGGSVSNPPLLGEPSAEMVEETQGHPTRKWLPAAPFQQTFEQGIVPVSGDPENTKITKFEKVAPVYRSLTHDLLANPQALGGMKHGMPQQWVNALTKAGAKKEEMDWLGIGEGHPNTKIAREEMLARAKSRMPKLSEKFMGERGTEKVLVSGDEDEDEDNEESPDLRLDWDNWETDDPDESYLSDRAEERMNDDIDDKVANPSDVEEHLDDVMDKYADKWLKAGAGASPYKDEKFHAGLEPNGLRPHHVAGFIKDALDNDWAKPEKAEPVISGLMRGKIDHDDWNGFIKDTLEGVKEKFGADRGEDNMTLPLPFGHEINIQKGHSSGDDTESYLEPFNDAVKRLHGYSDPALAYRGHLTDSDSDTVPDGAVISHRGAPAKPDLMDDLSEHVKDKLREQYEQEERDWYYQDDESPQSANVTVRDHNTDNEHGPYSVNHGYGEWSVHAPNGNHLGTTHRQDEAENMILSHAQDYGDWASDSGPKYETRQIPQDNLTVPVAESGPVHRRHGLPFLTNYREHTLNFEPQAHHGEPEPEPEPTPAPIPHTELPPSFHVIHDANGMDRQGRPGYAVVPEGQPHGRSMTGRWHDTPEAAKEDAIEFINNGNQYVWEHGERNRRTNWQDRENARKASSTFTRSHYGPNTITSTLMGDAKDENGKTLSHFDEGQSDWHQKGVDEGYLTGDTAKKMEEAKVALPEIRNNIDAARKNFSEKLGFMGSSSAIDSYVGMLLLNPTSMTDQEKNAVLNATWRMDPKNMERLFGEGSLEKKAPELVAGFHKTAERELGPDFKQQALAFNNLHQKLEDAEKASKGSNIPDAPWKETKSHAKLMIKRQMRMAADYGKDGMSMSPGWLISHRWGGNEGHIHLYDNIFRSAFEEVAKEAGLKLQKANIPKLGEYAKSKGLDHDGTVPAAYFTPEAREKIRKEGFKLFKRGGAVKRKPKQMRLAAKAVGGVVSKAEGGSIDESYLPPENPQREENLNNLLADSKTPPILYHGTKDDVREFDLNHPNRKDAGWLGHGVYLFDRPDAAALYATRGKPDGANVMPLHAPLKNPYLATLADKQRLMLLEHEQGKEAARDAAKAWTKELQEKGHDGVKFEGAGVGWKDAPTEYVAFDPKRVKSAIGNRGTFDPTETDITKATGGAVKRKPKLKRLVAKAVGCVIAPSQKDARRAMIIAKGLAKTP